MTKKTVGIAYGSREFCIESAGITERFVIDSLSLKSSARMFREFDQLSYGVSS
jgi:hypothetical protein